MVGRGLTLAESLSALVLHGKMMDLGTTNSSIVTLLPRFHVCKDETLELVFLWKVQCMIKRFLRPLSEWHVNATCRRAFSWRFWRTEERAASQRASSATAAY